MDPKNAGNGAKIGNGNTLPVAPEPDECTAPSEDGGASNDNNNRRHWKSNRLSLSERLVYFDVQLTLGCFRVFAIEPGKTATTR